MINPGLTREKLEKTWIVENGYMTVEEILGGVDFSEIKDELQGVIDSCENGITAFNRIFDVDFLKSYGISFPKLLPCPMLLSTNICKLPKFKKFHNTYPGYKWPKVEEAYKHFFPDSNYVELHRGADDAFHEADIVLELYKIGVFKVS